MGPFQSAGRSCGALGFAVLALVFAGAGPNEQPQGNARDSSGKPAQRPLRQTRPRRRLSRTISKSPNPGLDTNIGSSSERCCRWPSTSAKRSPGEPTCSSARSAGARRIELSNRWIRSVNS